MREDAKPKSADFNFLIKSIGENTYRIYDTIIDRVKPSNYEELNENETLIFENVNYNKDYLNEIKFNKVNIKFQNCQFRRKLFLNLNNTDLEISSNPTTNDDKLMIKIVGKANKITLQNLSLSECHLFSSKTQELSVTRNNIGLLFIQKSKIDTFNISNEKPSYSIKNLKFDITEFNIINISHLNDVRKIDIDFCRIEKLVFEKVIVSEKISFTGYKTNDLELEKSKIASLLISISDIKKYNMISGFSLNRIKLNSSNFENIDITQNGKLSKLKEFTISGVKRLNIENLNIGTLTLKNKIEESEIVNLAVDSINFESFYSINGFKMINVDVKGEKRILSMKDSNFDNVILNPSFLHKFKEIKFNNSSLLNLQANSLSEIPTSTIKPLKRNENTNYLILYRELKSLASKYGDNYLYHKFKALEYNERIRYWTINFFRSKDFSLKDYFILVTNKISNNHTTNPFISFSWIVYLLYAYIGIINSCTRSNLGYKLFYNHIDIFIIPFKLLISIKNEILIFDSSFPKSLFFIDIVYHIVLSYLIYQMIAAFRKFNR